MSSVAERGRVELVCEVTAWPAPALGIFRDRNLSRAVSKEDPRLKLQTFSNRDSPGDYKLVLDISNVTSSDGGQYFCHAANSVGSTTAVLGLSVLQPVLLHRETLECCRDRNVSSPGCVDQFCDPLALAEVGIKDMMSCAPWAEVRLRDTRVGADRCF